MAVAKYRIQNLLVEGFRGFTSPQMITFDRQNVFVFGQNGFGKSSIIEAIQWCLFGGSDIQVRNSEYEKQECCVVLELTATDGAVKVHRALHPGRTESDLTIYDNTGKAVALRDVFPELAKLKSSERTQVIFAAQHATNRRVLADITDFGRVLCFYLKLEDVPNLVKVLSDTVEDRQDEIETFAKRIEEIGHIYRQGIDTVKAQIDTILENPPWGSGPSPTTSATEQRIRDFVREIFGLVDRTLSADLSAAEQLRAAEQIVSGLTEQDAQRFESQISELAHRLQAAQELLAEGRQLTSEIKRYEQLSSDLSTRTEKILGGQSRDLLIEEIRKLEAAYSRKAQSAAIAENVAKFCGEHQVTACPVCGSKTEPVLFASRLKKAQEDLQAASEASALQDFRSRLAELDAAIRDQKETTDKLDRDRSRYGEIVSELAQSLSATKENSSFLEVENRITQLQNEIANLQSIGQGERDQKQKLILRLKSFRQELEYHNYRGKITELQQKLTAGMEDAKKALRDFQDYIVQVRKLNELVSDALKAALDRAIPRLNDLLTEVYQRLTQQRSFELVCVYHDPERIGHLELQVASKRRPNVRFPPNVLNGQANKALHLVPYFVFSRFRADVLELDLLLVDDPSESFDTSHVGLLMEELVIASRHAQLVVASHEKDKFIPYLNTQFGPKNFISKDVIDFDPNTGPKIEQ